MSGKPTVPTNVRRDPRSDPDDDTAPSPPPSQRVDVVNVDRGDSISAVANTMRRELAKLHQQASAFERTLEDQRRERADALDRAERATAHALSLEARISRMENETQALRQMHETALDDLQKTRAERDDLARALEAAKGSSAEVARLENELAGALKSREETARAMAALETELSEIRKREHQEAAKGNDKDAEIAALRAKVERLTADVAAAKDEASTAQADLVKARQDLEDARAATKNEKEAAERERTAARDERERLERQLAEARAAREELVAAKRDLAQAQQIADDASMETARMAREVEAARQERDGHVERAAMMERENIDLRLADEGMRRQLEGALQAAMHAEARADVAERARQQVEDGVRQLRDEITTAFARIRLVAPSLAPPPAEPLSARIAASVPPPPRPPSDYTPSPGAVANTRSATDIPRLFDDSLPPPNDPSGPPPATRAATPLARRDDLIAQLADPNDARNAADALKKWPESLRGEPTRELLDALSHADYDAERPVFEVARAWEREPLCRALLADLRGARDPRAREHAAWLVKHLASPASWKDIAAIAANDEEATGVRRWLLDALGRLVAGRLVGWDEIGDLVTALARHPNATLRDGNVAIIASLDASDRKRDVLLDVLAREDDETVLTTAIEAIAALDAGASGPIDLDDEVVARLLEHPSDRVQRAAKDLLANDDDDDATIDVD